MIYKLNNNNKASSPGRKCVLSVEEEQKIATWIFECADRGFPKRKADVIEAAGAICHKIIRDRNFKNGLPGKITVLLY